MSSPVQENGGAYADTDAFAGLVFAISGKFTESHAALTSLIRRNAGDVKASVTKAVTHLVSTLDDFNGRSTKVEKALANGVPIVTERWVRESIEANEALPLRPEFVLHPGKGPLAESEEATKAKTSPPTASVDEGRKAELEAPTAAEDLTAAAAPASGGGAPIIDESKLPSAAVTMAKDASLPVLHPTIGAMHPTQPPAAAVAAPAPAPAPTEAQAQAPAAAPTTVVPPPVEQLPTAVQPTAAAAASPEAETQRIEATAAAAIPPVPAPSHEALVEAARANEPMEEETEAAKQQHEKRKLEETLTPNELPLPLEELPAKRAKLDAEAPEAETTPTPSAAEETAMPDVLERAPPAESGAGTAAVLPPSQAIPLAAAPPPAVDVIPSGAETGGPTSMRETQRVYDLKVLLRKEYSPSSAHELSGLIEKQLLEGINVHNDSTEGFGSLADVFARGVDGGAVLVENVRDYESENYFNLITYARQGKEFGSVHRNDEVLSCGLMRDGNLSAVRAEDQHLMERLTHVHQPIVPISGSASS